MVFAMTNRAVHFVLAVFAQLPVCDDVGGDIFVALDTILSPDCCERKKADNDEHKKKFFQNSLLLKILSNSH
jgi:hypothetical protein